MAPSGESAQVQSRAEFDADPFTGGLQRMVCTKMHGHPQSRKPVARRRCQFVGEVVPPAVPARKHFRVVAMILSIELNKTETNWIICVLKHCVAAECDFRSRQATHQVREA